MSEVVDLYNENKKLQRLEDKLTTAIREAVQEQSYCAAEVSGVLRTIELRLFLEWGRES